MQTIKQFLSSRGAWSRASIGNIPSMAMKEKLWLDQIALCLPWFPCLTGPTWRRPSLEEPSASSLDSPSRPFGTDYSMFNMSSGFSSGFIPSINRAFTYHSKDHEQYIETSEHEMCQCQLISYMVNFSYSCYGHISCMKIYWSYMKLHLIFHAWNVPYMKKHSIDMINIP